MMITDSGVKLYNDGQFPRIRVTVRDGEERVYDIDDRRSTVKKINDIINNTDSDKQDEEILVLVLGKKATKEICDSDISMKDFNSLVKQIMSIVTGESVEQMEARSKNG